MTSEARALAMTVRPAAAAASHDAKSSPRTVAGIAGLILVATAILPLAVGGPIALAALLGWVMAELGGARPFAAYATWHRRTLRRESRERALLWAGVGRETLWELDRLVTAIEARDAELVKRLDLETLLDRYVTLALAHARAVRAAAMSDRKQLEYIRNEQRADPTHDPRRLELCERRLRCLDQCETKAQWFADEIAILCDTLRLIAQRSACPEDPPADDKIEHCIAELDAREEADGELR